MGKDKTKDGDATTSTEMNRDHSRDKEARDTVLARTITEAVAWETQSIAGVFARQMEKAHVQYQDLLKESHTAALPTTLKVTSGSDGFRVMDPFDWKMDKNVYQIWQLWSHKARLTLEAMEGDTEKTKISYLHHWLNGEGAKFFCLFLWLCINVLRDIGECCKSVPLDHTGSYVSISMNITRILACVVQVDAFIISL